MTNNIINIKLLEFIKNCKNNTEEWINTEDLKSIYEFLEVNIEHKIYLYECEKSKKKIEKLEHENPASLKYKDIINILEDLKESINSLPETKIKELANHYFSPKKGEINLKKHYIFSEMIDLLTPLLNIKKNTSMGVSYYYLDDKEQIYKELNEHNLAINLKEMTDYNFNTDDCTKLLKTITNETSICTDYIVCKNGLINKKNGKLESKDLIYEELITDNLMFTSGDGKSKLLEYIPDVQIDNADSTLLEKTLKEICIPKSEPENLKIYIDRLQRFGANILDRKHKSIGYYYTNHQNSGKSGLRSIHSRLMKCAVISPKIFDDNFTYNQIGNKKAILIDETQKGDLEKNKSHIKFISSPDSRQDDRMMYSDKTTKTKYGNLEIYTNHLINLNKNEDTLFYRIDVIQLPNKFVETKEELKKIKNSYLVNEKLFDNGGLIETDYKGWCWLASASIQEYLKMEKAGKKFECRQNSKETMQILLKADPLTEFLVKHISYVDDGSVKTSNKEILTEFKYFCETKGYSITDNDNSLAKQIGFKLKDEYGESVKSAERRTGAKYFIKIKKIEEIEEEFRQVYIMNEKLTDKQVDWLKTLQGHRKRIYDDIKTGEANTIFKLNKKYHDVDNTEIMKELENLGLIVKTFDTST